MELFDVSRQLMGAVPHLVRFVLDGKVVVLERPPPTLTVLEYLREVAGRRGTKEGCAEGDCGACTVVLGELSPDQRTVEYRAVNSCIRFLPTLDGKELVTVESLQPSSQTPHPVQQALLDNHASQCGFCTPGFVMSLFALYLQCRHASRDEVVDCLAGNLCRCTGYRPIIEAGMRQFDYPSPAHWGREAAHSAAHVDALRAIARTSAADQALDYQDYCAPRTIEDLAAVLEARPDSIVLAGGTDVGLWVTKHLRELPHLVYLGDVRELRRIEARDAELWIGAAVSHTDAWPALLARFPELAETAARFASPPIRNSATLCGNLANGSPIGDSIPTLIALGASLELRCGAALRRIPLEDFCLGHRERDLRPGEFVTGVAIPAAPQGLLLASYKVSKRIDQDISGVCATFAVVLSDGRISETRLSFGGMAATACRAKNAEAALIRTGWSEAGIEAASAALGRDFTPLTDFRAGSDYRLRIAGNLLRRFHAQRRLPATAATRTLDALPALG